MNRLVLFVLWAALVPYAWFQVRFIMRLAAAPEMLGAASVDPAAWRRYVARRAAASVFGGMFWIACALASSGALRLPRYVSEPVVGAEIAFVIDASNSMLTDDGGGKRLDLAKDFAARLAASAGGAGLSVVAFRGLPATLCPSTRDRRAFEDALFWAGPTVTSAAGTDVGAAIDEAVRPAFRAGTARVIVVLGDGNDTGGSARLAASRAAATGAVLAFVGFGGPVSLPVADPDGKPVTGPGGRPAATALDEAAMRDWAAAGRGTYVNGGDPGAFPVVAALCAEAARSPGRRRDVRVEVDAAPALAVVALVSLGLALVLSAAPCGRTARPPEPRSRRKKERADAKTRRMAVPVVLEVFVALALVTLASCGSADAFAVTRANRLFREGYAHEAAALYLKAGAGEEPVASYNLANVFAALGEQAPARAMFDVAMAEEEAGIVARSWYNIGVEAFSRGAYAEAAASFRKALEASASDGLDVVLVHEFARAYELARKADADRRDAGVTERSRYGTGRIDGSLQPFALSRTDEKTLFAPGDSSSGSAVDH